MKKSIRWLGFAFFSASTILMSCSSPKEKVEKAEENVTEAKEQLEQTNENYRLDMEDYRTRTAEQIAANEKSIAAFNARIESEKSDVKKEYKEKIAALNLKNTDMKKRIDDFKVENQSNWESFKAEFSRDMETRGNAIRDFTTKSDKK
jgi:regulator of replication initiation timing